MDDHHLGPGGGMPPKKRAKLDETSGRPVGTNVGLGRKGRTVGACSLSLGGKMVLEALGGKMVLEGREFESYQW